MCSECHVTPSCDGSCRTALRLWVLRSNRHTSSWCVRFWVSVGRTRTKIALRYLTESTRGSGVCWVWGYTGSCPSTYRPLMVDTTASEYRIQRAVVWCYYYWGVGRIFSDRQTRNVCEFMSKYLPLNYTLSDNTTHYCTGSNIRGSVGRG